MAAVVGDSLGELATMAISGVLSCEDGLRPVATRASMVRDKWGPERGAMLAIQAELETVKGIISCSFDVADEPTRSPEVACFHGPMSQVVMEQIE